MSVDFRSYLLYGHKLGDAKIDEKIEMILDEEVDSIGGIDCDDIIEDWLYDTFRGDNYIAVEIAKVYEDEAKEIADFEKAIKEAQEKLQEFYRKIGGFTYSETDKDGIILLLDSGVR